jgi:hypothetical protein
MRGEDAPARREARGGGDACDAERRLTAAARPAPRARMVSAPAGRPSEEPVAATPRLYSGGGGAAIPAAGFLGFDRGR